MLAKLIFLNKCCLFILFLYMFLNFCLRNVDEYCKHDYNKRCYIVKNIIKSFMLFLMTIFTINRIFIPALGDNWNNTDAHIFSSIYVSNDIIGLLVIPKLPPSTKFHHIVTTLLLFYSYTIDFREENVGRWMFIYTMMSTFSFLVNLYLALRYLTTSNPSYRNNFINYIRISAYYIYLFCCFINWAIHIGLLSNKIFKLTLKIPYIVYCLLLIPIINDDIILLKWLKYKTK